MLSLIGGHKLRYVYGIDIDIRPHTHEIIEQHPMKKHIIMIEGSSIEQDVIGHVTRVFSEAKVMVILDSNHTHDHVLAELRAYAPLVSKGCYCVVCDTAIEDLPCEIPGRPWGKGNNPKTAVWQFLKENDNFKIDREIESKLIITGSPDGFLRKIK
jgi:cephalosporin hydroxylase